MFYGCCYITVDPEIGNGICLTLFFMILFYDRSTIKDESNQNVMCLSCSYMIKFCFLVCMLFRIHHYVAALFEKRGGMPESI
jgi:hypothetical protein